jgi:hypothetical protein
MAKRPIFFSSHKQGSLLETREVDFIWHPGLSVSQKQKSIASLHLAAKEQLQLCNILEISSKSKIDFGIKLSAFNLCLTNQDDITASVESFFQGSKVFTKGGPYIDLYQKSSREAKKDPRILESGELLKFNFDNNEWPLKPPTVFYDWLYCSALTQNQDLAEALLDYDSFTDIEFNPSKSINCQAASAAIYKSMCEKGLINDAMKSYSSFIKIHIKYSTSIAQIQETLF